MRRKSACLLAVLCAAAAPPLALAPGNAAAQQPLGGQQADPNFDVKVAQPAYTTEHPRVLFDEAHRNFHTSTIRYKPFADLITSDGYQVIRNWEEFTAKTLRKGVVLIVANALGTPTSTRSAFTDAECDAVRDWVRDGGSLLLITDRQPFGAAAEALAGRFEVQMSKGFTFDPDNSSGDPSWLVFSRENKLLGDHPITRGRDNRESLSVILTFCGQSLKGPRNSATFLRLGDTAKDHFVDGTESSAAGRAQGLALSWGKGRVVVLGEAGLLSAQFDPAGEPFGMNLPGLDNRQLALNIMHWLSDLLQTRNTP